MAREIVKSHSSSSIGSVKQSMLDEATFQSIHGTGWVLMDGRDVTGSDYDTIVFGGIGGNIPDARGQFLRGKDHGRHLIDGKGNPDGDLALGFQQTDEFEEHTHFPTGFFNNGVIDNSRLGIFTSNNGSPRTGLDPTTATGGSETRPKNTTVNIFIKINE
jgi:hypothetical protein